MAIDAPPLRLLVLEDDKADLKLLRHHLAGDSQTFSSIYLEAVENLSDAMSTLENALFDAMLMDLNVTDSQGLDTFVKLHQRFPGVPVIILSGLNDEHMAIKAVKAGAQDYLPKSELNKFKLLKTISYAIERATLLSRAIEGQEAAKKASLHKSEFLARMSHEIRTPMNGVIGMTSLLGETQLTSEQAEYVNTIRKSSHVLMNIINDILDLSKIEAGKMQLEPTVFNIRRIIEETLDLYAEMAHSKNLLLANLVDPEIPAELIGDDSKIRQILGNLINNALKFTERGQVTVHVSLKATRDDGSELSLEDDMTHMVLFEVKDSGAGIAEENRRQLFRAFTQIKDSPRQVVAGTGLGLVICKRLAELMGGEIGVTSELGKGSTFWFTSALIKSPLRSSLRADLSKKRVLIFSESNWISGVLVQLLKMRGLAFKIVNEQTSVLKHLLQGVDAQQAFDLLIIDPGNLNSNKHSLFQAIEQEPRLGNLPSLVLAPPTANASQDIPASSRISILKLPLKQSAFYEKIAAILSGDAGKPEAAAPLVSAKRPRRATPSSKHERILIADDSSVNQKVASIMVSKLGYESDAVANGLEALTAVEQGQYSLVLMDCEMPEMDGFEATMAIRALPEPKASLPIIAMTANALKDYALRCIESGMDAVITKPVILDDVRSALEPWFGHGASSIDEPRAEPALVSFPQDSAAAIDRAVIEKFYQGPSSNQSDTAAFVNELIDMFLEIVPPIIEDILKAEKDQNLVAVGRLGHKLKGTSRNLGARHLAARSEKLESLARLGQWAGIDTETSKLKDEFAQAEKELLSKYKTAGVKDRKKKKIRA